MHPFWLAVSKDTYATSRNKKKDIAEAASHFPLGWLGKTVWMGIALTNLHRLGLVA